MPGRMTYREALSELSMAVGDLESLAEAVEDDRADNYRTSEALEVLAEPQTVAVDLGQLLNALEFWQRIAGDNDWKVRSLTVWVRADGTVEDSVGISEGSGLFLVPSEKGVREDD